MHPLVKDIVTVYKANADAENAAGAKAYLRHQFNFVGLKTPLRRGLAKEVFKQYSFETEADLVAVAKTLWDLPEREYQYACIELIARHKKLWTADIISFFHYLITTKSWWDTVDFIVNEHLAPYFKQFPEQIIPVTGEWNVSDNFWLQRSSLLFQKSYKKELDTELLTQYILNCSSSKEFFIQKAIGWVLREYAKTNPQWVLAFVQTNTLAPLSKREATKHILVKE